MVLDPVVEEPKDVLPVVVSCQDGESVGVPFCSFYQRLVFVADGYSCGGPWDVNQFVLQVAVIAKCKVLVVEHSDVSCFYLLAVVACDLDIQEIELSHSVNHYSVRQYLSGGEE